MSAPNRCCLQFHITLGILQFSPTYPLAAHFHTQSYSSLIIHKSNTISILAYIFRKFQPLSGTDALKS